MEQSSSDIIAQLAESHDSLSTAYLLGQHNQGVQIGSNYGSIGNVYIGSSGRSERDESSGKPFSTNPFRQDPDFINRGIVLDQIHAGCSQPAARLALVGLGGVGKSQLAVQYCYELRSRSPRTWVFWIHASSRARFEEGFEMIGGRLGLIKSNDDKVNILQLVKNWLCDESKGQWVMIVDNADNAATFFDEPKTELTRQLSGRPITSTPLANFLPQTSNGSILFTSRNEDVAAKLTGSYKDIIKIGPMETEEGLSLLQKKLDYSGRPRDDASDLSLLQALEYMPLAVTQAAAYINRLGPRGSVPGYLRLFHESEESRADLLGKEAGDLWRDDSARNSIFTTWQISFEQIKEERPSAADLLSLMSFFNRQGIPDFVLRSYKIIRLTDPDGMDWKCWPANLLSRMAFFVQDTVPNFMLPSCINFRAVKPACTQDDYDYEDPEFELDLALLRSYSLITVEREKNVFEMHRLVQLSTRVWLKLHEKFDHWYGMFLATLAANTPRDKIGFEEWDRCQTLFPHVEAAVALKPAKGSARDWSSAVAGAAEYAYKRGKYEVAEKMARCAMDESGRSIGWADYHTLKAGNLLALVLQKQRKFDAAEEMHKRILEGYKQKLGGEHLLTLTSASNLVATLTFHGNYGEAEKTSRQALDGFYKALGGKHPDTLMILSNLAVVLTCQHKYEEAERMTQAVLESREEILGTEHSDTLISVFNLAVLVETRRDHESALELFKRAYPGLRKVLGASHPDTVRCERRYRSALRLLRKTNSGMR